MNKKRFGLIALVVVTVISLAVGFVFGSQGSFAQLEPEGKLGTTAPYHKDSIESHLFKADIYFDASDIKNKTDLWVYENGQWIKFAVEKSSGDTVYYQNAVLKIVEVIYVPGVTEKLILEQLDNTYMVISPELFEINNGGEKEEFWIGYVYP